MFVEDIAEALLPVDGAATTPRELWRAKAQIREELAGTTATWGIGTVIHPRTALNLPVDEAELLSRVTTACQAFISGIEITANLPRKVKDRERNAAMRGLRAALAGVNQSILASSPSAHSASHEKVAACALHR